MQENIEYLTWDEHTFWDNLTQEELDYRISLGEDWGYMIEKERRLKAAYPSESAYALHLMEDSLSL